ncbi:MAG: hypothetical protein NVSMB26_13320 [Beijerinckiaceae bacterium]
MVPVQHDSFASAQNPPRDLGIKRQISSTKRKAPTRKVCAFSFRNTALERPWGSPYLSADGLKARS